MKALLAVMALALLDVIPAEAQSHRPGALPRYDIEQGCEARAHGSFSGRNLCIRQEQEAYDEVKLAWSHFDSDLRAKCVIGYPSYEGLLNCLTAEIPIQQSRGQAHFHY